MSISLICAVIILISAQSHNTQQVQAINQESLDNFISGHMSNDSLNIEFNNKSSNIWPDQIDINNSIKPSQYQSEFLKQDLIELIFNRIISPKNGLPSSKLSYDCHKSIINFHTNIQNGSILAMKMYDASSRTISGLLDGTFLNLGDFDQCLNIKDHQSTDYMAKYFLINLVPVGLNQTREGLMPFELHDSNSNFEQRLLFLFRFPDLINLKIGLCLPAACKNNEIQNLINRTANSFYWKIENDINSSMNESFLIKLMSSNIEVKISFIILTSLLSFVLISTLIDSVFSLKKTENIFFSLIQCMSIVSNFRKLHSHHTPKHKNNFVSKNRYYSEILVNLTHFIVFVPLLGCSVINERIFDWLPITQKFYLQSLFTDCYYPGIIIMASTTVSLKMFCMIKQKASGQELINNLVKRMVIFWPILIVLISIQICLPLFNSGPLVEEFIKPMAVRCEKHWMLNLLFINNFVPLHETCLPHTWTISCELQLYLIASLLTFLYIKHPKIALPFNIGLILVGLISNFYVIYTGLAKSNVFSLPFSYYSLRNSIFYTHSNTLVQFSPYFSIFLAFYLRLSKRSLKMSIGKEMRIGIWLLIYFITTFHTSILFNTYELKVNSFWASIYYLYNRSSFTLLLSWFVLQYWPNGEPSRKKEIKIWIRYSLLGKKDRKKSDSDRQHNGSILERLVDRLDALMYGTEMINETLNVQQRSKLEQNVNKKISSSDSTSDLSDHSNKTYNKQIDTLIKNQQDANNNTNHDFYNRKLIDTVFEEQIDTRSESSNAEKNQKEDENIPKRPTGRTMVWIKLSKSIYYSHFFYLMVSLFNVNTPQKSDLLSLVISIHSKLFWAYVWAYLFHLLIEAAVTNLTEKLIEVIWKTDEKTHND